LETANTHAQSTTQALHLVKQTRRRKAQPAIVTPEELLALQAKAMGEKKDLQPAVMRLLSSAGWLAYHTWNSQHSAAGFLDVLAIKETETEWWLLIAELKSESGKLTAAQQQWHTMWTGLAWAINNATAFSEKILRACGWKIVRVEVCIWRPSDYLSGAIDAVVYAPTGMQVAARKGAKL
jgi:hypothetical protein